MAGLESDVEFMQYVS
uniref:Uncharacterized protein n=1 Tax=Rhizophora mucronata TaxID=61149 RepID=A0A2P2QRR4_RHIMU